ncbi:MAG TPA: bifunctional helix-turn-helix transcriptional regulator/GNAT family N-acetyltransferase [Candidatus Limnocylindria bacterium]|nr:bifunctional helix-turn-helix transcriptional regulator/GNAT family N-acetyltransferase [Candidatus Limnocylindria bacterium]
MGKHPARTRSRSAPAFDRRVADVRGFSRFYTRQVGLLRDGYLESPFSLTEARVLYELTNREHAVAAELTKELGLDAGYLSRILASFRRRGLMEKRPSAEDGRRSELRLTKRGRTVFASLDARARDDIGTQLARLAVPDQERLVGAMATVERLLGEPRPSGASYVLREPRSGDYGWVVQRHGAIYAEEYGWNEEFEALVAGIVGKFVEDIDPKRERCWIAERDGENVGCVFAVRESAKVAKLRLLLVEPSARGLGIGKRLVDECIAFSRAAGYTKLRLWTNGVLRVARHIYEEAGFELVAEDSHHSFGKDLVGETWDLKL